MNVLDWRNLWDLAVAERDQREARLEQHRIWRDAGIRSGGATAWTLTMLGNALVAAGERLSAPATRPAEARVAA